MSMADSEARACELKSTDTHFLFLICHNFSEAGNETAHQGETARYWPVTRAVRRQARKEIIRPLSDDMVFLANMCISRFKWK